MRTIAHKYVELYVQMDRCIVKDAGLSSKSTTGCSCKKSHYKYIHAKLLIGATKSFTTTINEICLLNRLATAVHAPRNFSQSRTLNRMMTIQ